MALSRQDVILSCFVALFGWTILTTAVPSLRFTPYAYLTGLLTAIFGLLYVLVSFSYGPQIVQLSLSTPSTYLALTSTNGWPTETKALKERLRYRQTSVYTSSSRISKRIDKVLELILRDFLKSWSTKISGSTAFINEVDGAIRVALHFITDKVLAQDLVELGVTKLLPIINGHIKSFSEAEHLVRGKNLTLDVTETDELDLAIATKYRDGRLHPATSLAAHKTSASQQQHMRRLVGRLITEVLPDSMTTSASVLVLIREILACAVLVPVLQMLSDPDSLCQVIEAYGRSVLYERKTVRRLRAALDEHATPAKYNKTADSLPRLRPGDSERSFERFIRAIRHSGSLSEARRCRSEILRTIKRDAATAGQDSMYLRRLEIGRKVVEQRIAQLSGAQPSHRVSYSDHTSSIGDGNGRRENSTLREVLYDASGLSYFMEFMDRIHIMSLVQFWIVVDGMRNPLDGEMIDADNPRSWTNSDREDIIQIGEAYLSKPELKVSKASLQIVRDFVSTGSRATWDQYMAARKVILGTQDDIFTVMKERHFQGFKKSDLFYKWLTSGASRNGQTSNGSVRPNLSRQTSPLAPPKESSHPPFAKLKRTDLRRAAVSSSDLFKTGKEVDSHSASRRSLDDTAARPSLFDDDYDTDPLANSTHSLDSDVDPVNRNGGEQVQIVAAVQAALDDIVDQEHDKDSLFSSHDIASPQEELDNGRVPYEFPLSGEASPSPSTGKPSLASLGLLGTPSRRTVFSEDDLFGESEKLWEDDGETTDKDNSVHDDKIREAAPGDLGLAELVQSLSMEIEKLEAQQTVVETLTRKAELTNNAAELRILRKSKASLEREIQRQELQRQQYIVQQSENDLYGRATVSIKRIMIGTEEDGHEFALYVIEVQRQAGEGAPAVAWAVAKRYSEFHDLHKRLRARYPIVRDLDFPRRQIVLTLQKDFLRKRRAALEKYLRELLTKPAICRSIELRAFLSQQAIRPIAESDGRQVDRQDFITRIYNSVTDGMEEFLGNTSVLDQLSSAGQNLITAASVLPAAQIATGSSSFPASIANDPATAAEVEAEINALETTRYPETTSFIRPICDTFVELFQLHQGNNWLRGRAVVVVLQQLLGGTIERKVRESFKAGTSEDSIVKGLDQLLDILWPDGKFRTSPPARTEAEKAKSRAEASLVLATLLPDVAGGVVGRGNAARAARRIFATLNNERLNQHLVYTFVDEVVEAVFGIRVAK